VFRFQLVFLADGGGRLRKRDWKQGGSKNAYWVLNMCHFERREASGVSIEVCHLMGQSFGPFLLGVC
jgi:hypothetical protein